MGKTVLKAGAAAEAAPGEAGEAPGRDGLAAYGCEDCSLVFWVPKDAPQHLDGFQELDAREGLPDYGLSCPWCMGWCYPQKREARKGAGGTTNAPAGMRRGAGVASVQ
jgi:hypothetical protein